MQETKTQKLRGFRDIIIPKKAQKSHSIQKSCQNRFFIIEGIKMLNQTNKFKQQKECESQRLRRNQFFNLFKQQKNSLKIDNGKTINNTYFTRKNYTQQKPSVLNFEFSLDQNVFRNQSIDTNTNRKSQRYKQKRRDSEMTERERFYTVQFTTKSEGKYQTRNHFELNVLKYQKLQNSLQLSSDCKQKYQI
ncbi:unnamed protein product [Paramecium sonneborni]|uniref:Uncharacterized protein n=1 Tax=Paramecium sonneborni TaxID=65129 RepID=A0A8S1NY36_9CILI|nr:unnamed protein product [Paramecium sonneborni]